MLIFHLYPGFGRLETLHANEAIFSISFCLRAPADPKQQRGGEYSITDPFTRLYRESASSGVLFMSFIWLCIKSHHHSHFSDSAALAD